MTSRTCDQALGSNVQSQKFRVESHSEFPHDGYDAAENGSDRFTKMFQEPGDRRNPKTYQAQSEDSSPVVFKSDDRTFS